MQLGHPVGIDLVEAAAQEVGEEPVVALPAPPRIERATSWSPAIQPSVRASRAATPSAVRSRSMVWLRNAAASSAVKRRSAARISVDSLDQARSCHQVGTRRRDVELGPQKRGGHLWRKNRVPAVESKVRYGAIL